MKSKKHQVVVDYDLDFLLWGIVSSAREYQLAWHLNKIFNIRFKKMEDVTIEFVKNASVIISYYNFATANKNYKLLKNQSFLYHENEIDPESFENDTFRAVKPNFLLPELKDFDYLLILQDETGEYDEKVVSEMLKHIPLIHYSMSINKEKINSLQNLLF